MWISSRLFSILFQNQSGDKNPSNDEYSKNNFESSLIGRNLSTYAYCPRKALQPKEVPFRNGEDSQYTQGQL